MSGRQWYLLAYDIREPRRLQRVHYYLRKRGLAAQQSVFFVHAGEAELTATLDGLAERMDLAEDDLRAYPVPHPGEVWLSGQAFVTGALLPLPERTIAQKPPAPEVKQGGLRALVARWWRK